MWKIENMPDELMHLVEEPSKQNVKQATWLLLVVHDKVWVTREYPKKKNFLFFHQNLDKNIKILGCIGFYYQWLGYS
jgi:hypothetical protein